MKALKKHYKLIICKLLDKEAKKYIWEEVEEVNLGSIRNPNKNILAFRFEPIDSEQRGSFNSFFKTW